jgi:hypothetical protein
VEYEIVKLSLLSGVQCTVYSIVPEKGGMTLYDDFAKENIAEYREEVRDINNRLKLIGTRYGARYSYFKQFEGKYGDLVCALYELPDKNLRLYCIRHGTDVVILGGGGLKTEDTRAWQDDPKLTEEATKMIEYAKDIAKRMDDGEIYMSRDKPELEGNFYYFEDKEE